MEVALETLKDAFGDKDQAGAHAAVLRLRGRPEPARPFQARLSQLRRLAVRS